MHADLSSLGVTPNEDKPICMIYGHTSGPSIGRHCNKAIYHPIRSRTIDLTVSTPKERQACSAHLLTVLYSSSRLVMLRNLLIFTPFSSSSSTKSTLSCTNASIMACCSEPSCARRITCVTNPNKLW